MQDQFQVRSALEKALGYRTSTHGDISDPEMPKVTLNLIMTCRRKLDLNLLQVDLDFAVDYNSDFIQIQPATELIKEIAVLEVEVMHLEQYLLSLYRKAFDGQASSISPPPTNNERLKSPVTTPRIRLLDPTKAGLVSKRESSAIQSGCQSLENPWKESNGIGGGSGGDEKLLDSSVHRCHSSLSQRSTFSTRTSPPGESSGKTVRYCHSQPLSMIEVKLPFVLAPVFLTTKSCV